MGCDIHFFAEVKLNGKWYLHSTPQIDRWYALFEKMAGVRGEDENAIVPPKGLPEDISPIVEKYFDIWKLDAHSQSWLNPEEISQLEIWLKEQHKGEKEYFYPEKIWGYLFGNSWSGFSKYPESYEGIEDVRFVFWFDN